MSHLADGRINRPIHQLIVMARDELALIDTQIRWLTALEDGQTATDTAGTSSNIAADPVYAAHGAASQARRRIRKAHARLATLVDNTLPSIARSLELDANDPRHSDRPLLSDDNNPDAEGISVTERRRRRDLGPASLDGGYSAYRGDRKVPRSRADLRQALDAQQRRIDRGEGYGAG